VIFSEDQLRGLKAARWLVKSKLCWRHPIYLIHSITSRCNAKCGFCAWHSDEAAPMADELGTEEIKELYQQARDIGFLGVSLWGGEPLVRKDLPELLEFAKSLGLTTNIVTNGALLGKKAAKVLPYLDHVSISLDYPGVEHDESRGVPRLYERIVEATRMMRWEYPATRVVLNCTVQKGNCDWRTIEAMGELARDLDVSIVFNPLRLEPAAEGVTEQELEGYNPLDSEVAEAFVHVKELKRRGVSVANSDTYLDRIIDPPLVYRCHWPKYMLPIEANGDVIDCTRWGRDPVDNVRDTSLREILESPRIRVLAGPGGERCHKCVSVHRFELSEIWEGRLGPLLSWGKSVIRRPSRPAGAAQAVGPLSVS